MITLMLSKCMFLLILLRIQYKFANPLKSHQNTTSSHRKYYISTLLKFS